MRTSILDPVGVQVTELPLSDLDDDDIRRLRELLALHGAVVLPGQDIDDEIFTAVLRRFGDLMFTAGETPVPGHRDLNVISNIGRDTPPRSTFHVDTSYVRRPPAYTALRAVTIPERGGETLFTNQYRAYETLPEKVRVDLAGRSITHVVTGVDPGTGQETAAEHPILRPHPASGRIALYLTAPARCQSISGLSEDDGRALVNRLFEHSTAEANVHRHSWSAGDVVMWDNGCVLHRADHTDVVGDRVMHRGMVAAGAGVTRG